MKPIHSFLICLLLIICGDIEQCPAPESYSADLRNICSFKGLKIVHLNTQGISTSFNGICELLGHKPEIDILTLSETHLQQEDTDELFKIIGYEFKRRDRTNSPWGGVAMYIKDGIKYRRRDDLEQKCLESLWIEIFINKLKNFLMTSFYRPPND